jgi:hypothetical protein
MSHLRNFETLFEGDLHIADRPESTPVAEVTKMT